MTIQAARIVCGTLLAASALWAQPYMISTLAGGALPPTPAAATSASFERPQAVTADSAGNVYFASLNSVFKVDRTGVLTHVAGTGRAGFSGDGSPAVSAQLSSPSGLAVDRNGNLYIADNGNNRVRQVSSTGVISTIAGVGSPSGAKLDSPSAVAVDGAGNVYVADASYIRKITLDGTATTLVPRFGITVTYSGIRPQQAKGLP